MADRRPVVVGASNQLGELPVGDTIAWSWLSGVPANLVSWSGVAPGDVLFKTGGTMSGTIASTASIAFDWQGSAGRLMVRDTGTGYPSIDGVNPANSAYGPLNFRASAYTFETGSASFTSNISLGGALHATAGVSVGADSDVYLYEGAANQLNIRTGPSSDYKYFGFTAGGEFYAPGVITAGSYLQAGDGNSGIKVRIGNDADLRDMGVAHALAITSATDVDQGIVYLGTKETLKNVNDGYLRLNNANQYANGVYTPGLFRVGGAVNFEAGLTVAGNTSTDTITMGSSVGQKISLYSGVYGIGIQNNTQYFRSAAVFAWHIGGSHDSNEANPGTGGTCVMKWTGGAAGGLSLAGKLTTAGDGNPGVAWGSAGLNLSGPFGGGIRMLDGSTQAGVWMTNDPALRFGVSNSGTGGLTEKFNISSTQVAVLNDARLYVGSSGGEGGEICLSGAGGTGGDGVFDSVGDLFRWFGGASVPMTWNRQNGALDVPGEVVGRAAVGSYGGGAILLFQDRTSSANFGWYSSGGVARLWHSGGTGDQIWSSNKDLFVGAAIFPGGAGSCYLYRVDSGRLAINQNFSVNADLNVGGQLYADSWIRSNTSGTGWYHQIHNGGIYMSDATWIRTYGGKGFLCDATMQGSRVEVTYGGLHQIASNGAAWIRQPRIFVGGGDPGAQAQDGDIWIP